ncbi:MAG: gamma-glutamyl-gamma-aminobutyrate hydrolase family protein [Acidimicrobiales bacterium]
MAVLVGRQPDARYSLHRGYVDALAAVGAAPLLVPAGAGLTHLDVGGWLGACSALLVTGGGDVAPAAYGSAPTTDLLDEVDPERDAVELAAVRWARRSGRPVLGICRGIQLVAAALGGSLCQDLPTAGHNGHWDLEREHAPSHAVKAEPGSLAEAALGGAGEVNSIHHQAVADPGPELVATAWSPDGVIEAVEARNGTPTLGLQWHPERLAGSDARHLAPFRWLVDIAGQVRP